MLKNALMTLVVLVIAIGGGTASVWYALNKQFAIGAIRIGQWTAFPHMGTPDADPYSKARTAREGVLALGSAEGLSFIAERDAAGDPLRRNCDYTIEGGFPAARFWTLYAADRSIDVIQTRKPRTATLHSAEILRAADNTVSISASSHPSPGNWLAVAGKGKLYFVLTFYDTPIASSTGLSDIVMPKITRSGCDA
jgi:hypothetical protein